MPLNLTEMSLDDLKQLEKDVAKAIKTYEERKRKEAIAAAQAAAREHGFNLGDLGVEIETKRSKSVSKPKYRHPENPELTWTGRGRKPNWFVEAREAGKSEEDMLIV